MSDRLRTGTWKQPRQAEDGTRILVTRYRPRGVRKDAETWDEWQKAVAPSRDLHATWFGRRAEAIDWDGFTRRYLAELSDQEDAVEALAARVRGGETLTLLCFCEDEVRCHRHLLREVLRARIQES